MFGLGDISMTSEEDDLGAATVEGLLSSINNDNGARILINVCMASARQHIDEQQLLGPALAVSRGQRS